MKKQDIINIIQAIKTDTNMQNIFGDRVCYGGFARDVDEIGLTFNILSSKRIDCRTSDMVSITIIDGKDPSTALDMKGYMDEVESFLKGNLKTFSGFESLSIGTNGDEALLKNGQERFVFVKRFIFVY